MEETNIKTNHKSLSYIGIDSEKINWDLSDDLLVIARMKREEVIQRHFFLPAPSLIHLALL